MTCTVTDRDGDTCICTQEPPSSVIAWGWTFGDGGTSADQSPTHEYAEPGTYEVCVTVTNDCGESSTCCRNIVVGDVEPPTITCPPVGPYSIGDDCNYPCPAVTASDDLDPNPTVTQDPVAGTPLTPGDYVISATACDAVGHCSTAECPISVVDASAPTVSCPPDRTAVRAECVNSWVDIGEGTASDPCGVASLSNDAPALFPPGETVVTWTACDEVGNCVSCEQTVRVLCLPTCDITYTPASPTTDDMITFDSGAADPDGTVVSVDWDFGDGGTGTGDPATHVYAGVRTYTVCVTVTDDQGGQTTCCTQVAVTYPCECDVGIDRTHCKMPAAGHAGQCKQGQIGAKNLSYTESCDVWLWVNDCNGNPLPGFPMFRTIGPGLRIRVRFLHCYTADEVGRHLWTWEVWPAECSELAPWDNVLLRKVNVHP